MSLVTNRHPAYGKVQIPTDSEVNWAAKERLKNENTQCACILANSVEVLKSLLKSLYFILWVLRWPQQLSKPFTRRNSDQVELHGRNDPHLVWYRCFYTISGYMKAMFKHVSTAAPLQITLINNQFNLTGLLQGVYFVVAFLFHKSSSLYFR